MTARTMTMPSIRKRQRLGSLALLVGAQCQNSIFGEPGGVKLDVVPRDQNEKERWQFRFLIGC